MKTLRELKSLAIKMQDEGFIDDNESLILDGEELAKHINAINATPINELSIPEKTLERIEELVNNA